MWYLALSFIVTMSSVVCASDSKIIAQHKKAVPVSIWYLASAKKNEKSLPVAQTLERCFTFTRQFTVHTQHALTKPTGKQIKEIKQIENSWLLIVLEPGQKEYKWQLYDTLTGTQIAHNSCRRTASARMTGYHIADQIWPLLTSQEGFFGTRIAYAKKTPGKNVKHIYVSDFDGTHEQCFINTPTINIAPRWNHDKNRPLLFYSDYTPKNVRLMVSDLERKSRVASNFDGLNMIPAFNQDGSKMVYCLSRGDGYCQIYYHDKDRFKNITHNYANNVSPSLTADGNTIFYCSDIQGGVPQLFAYDLNKDSSEQLTWGAYCATPRYSPQAQKLAYVKKVNGIMQLFLYDIVQKQHEQLTFDNQNKQECAWSPCGNWLIYAIGGAGQLGRIAMINRHAKEQFIITPKNVHCSYPDWSPKYSSFPELVEA